MARLLWLADVLRAAGLTVHEVDGWRTRGSDTYGPVLGVICHETRGSANSTDAGEIGVLVNGREGLSGPIAQLYLSRTGHWHVVASGTCHHVKTGWGGPFSGYGNDSLLGIEAQHAESEDWANKPVQYQSYIRGVAAILRHTGWRPPVGHKEHQPNDKPDPEFNMTNFRAQVAAAVAEGDDMQLGDQFDIAFDDGSPRYGAARERTSVQTALAVAQRRSWQAAQNSAQAVQQLAQVAADAKASRVAIEALVAAVNAGGGSVDSAAIIAHVDQLAAAERDRELQLLAEIADLQTELAATRAAAEAQLSPAERAAVADGAQAGT